MEKELKYKIVGELVEKFKEYENFYIADAGGLTVAQDNAFRKLCYQKNIEYRVVKNTLIAKALQEIDPAYGEFTDKVLKGFSGVLFSKESSKAAAQLLKEYRKGSIDKPKLKGASIDKAFFYGDDSLEVLVKLKSKNELIGEIIGLLQSPAKNVISALKASSGDKIAGLVKALGERNQ
jgi:large subunit ribosomal protein L10